MTSASQEPGTRKLKPISLSIAVAASFGPAAFGATVLLLWWDVDATSPAPVPGPVPTPTPSGAATAPGVSTAIRLDMVKIVLTVVAGIGGLVALAVAYRRQKVTEAADRHQREVAADTKHDLAERRITELYTKAVEQLGNEEGPRTARRLVRAGATGSVQRRAPADRLGRAVESAPPRPVARQPDTGPLRDALGQEVRTAETKRGNVAQCPLSPHLHPPFTPRKPLKTSDNETLGHAFDQQCFSWSATLLGNG